MAAMNFTTYEAQEKNRSSKERLRGWVSGFKDEFLFQFGDEDLEVAQILLNLPYRITNSLSDFRFSCSWGSKRWRSALDNSPPPQFTVSPPPPPPPTPVVKPVAKQEAATSPTTPLVFCPSDSDAKSKYCTRSKTTSVKRTRDEWLRIIDEKVETQETLVKEIDKAKLHLQKLQEENSKLKDQKQKVIETTVDMRRRENAVTECSQPQLQQQLRAVSDCIPSGSSTSTLVHHHPPSIRHLMINHPTIEQFQQQQHRHHQVGPLGFDLNIPADDMELAVQLQPLNHHQIVMMGNSHRAYTEQARAARQHRILKNKTKKTLRGTS